MGDRYTVTALSGTTVHLAPAPGSTAPPVALVIQLLAAAADFAVLNQTGAPASDGPLPTWSMLEGISADSARDTRIWRRHVIEVETGLLPDMPEGSTPREG
ncbi:hypothetical protein [Streptomyces griseoluteus]|uniref:hypothetical protein n=1 Tax=Streptomyces griseoluteus TaxID=29306 RepID=UPI0036F5C15D